MNSEYSSNLCNYCPCTEYGTQSINSGPWNLCEGCSCAEAFEQYREENEEELNEFLKTQGREMTIKDLF